jgi:hypothetical protein
LCIAFTGIKELVKIMCEGKTNLHPDVEVITVAEERKGEKHGTYMREDSL